jgi:trypsin
MQTGRSMVLALLVLGITSEYVESGGSVKLKGDQSYMKPFTSQTDNKVSGCGNCVFPFIFGRWIIETCTSIDGDSPWCATEVDSEGRFIYGSWEYCTSNTCPQPEPMAEHPENEEGKCYCGIPNTGNGNRIVGGVNTDIGEYPWQIGLLAANNIGAQICGGTLVSDRYVVTAAHCTAGRNASQLFVAVGDTILGVNDETTSFIYPVKTITDHPDYVDATEGNDISLLELDATIDLNTYPNIKPICLPEQGTTYGDQLATVSGLGTVGSNEPSPAHLNEVDVQIFPDGDCGYMNAGMTSDMICAGIKSGGKDSCQGDSGGPLFPRG